MCGTPPSIDPIMLSGNKRQNDTRAETKDLQNPENKQEEESKIQTLHYYRVEI